MSVEERLEDLAARVRRESEILAYPSRAWVDPVTDEAGNPVYDVIVVGGGQSGLAVAQGLVRDGIINIVVLDRNPEGLEGPWRTYARMAMLRTPKHQVGMDHGIPSLTTRAWYEAKYGAGSWAAVDKVRREDWMDYLRWYRKVLNLPVRNEIEVTAIVPQERWLELATRTPAGSETLCARRVVLATGYDGNGEWRIPPAIAAALPPERCVHSNTVIDFTRYHGKRVGILGNGASAFDAAVTALRHGAASVDLCFRRTVLPTINPHRGIEFVGFLKDYPELDDATRWRIGNHFETADQPPARHSFETAHGYSNFAMHAGSPWLAVAMEGDMVKVRTPQRGFAFDDVICATGSIVDLACRNELGPFAEKIALWRDRYTPPPHEVNDALGLYPYLGRHYELMEREPGTAPFLKYIYAFNFSGVVSMGPHSTSISGHKYSVPRMIRGITRGLFLEQQDRLMDLLLSYQEPEIEWPLRNRQTSAAE